jgi:phosphonate transport system substrate-binding protein
MANVLRGVLILLVLTAVALGDGGDHAARADSFGLVRLRIGAVGSSQFRPLADRLEPFRAYLAERMEMPVELQIFHNGQDLVEAAAHRTIDYGIFTAATYAAAWRSCGCIEPVVAAKSIDGTAGVKSILVVRGDSPYQKLPDLQGKVLIASDPRSIASRLVPLSELTSEGSDPTKLFVRIDTAVDPQAALLALLNRKADAALAWSTLEGEEGEGYDRGALHDLVARHLLDMHAIRIIWRSGLIPNGPHAVRDDLPLEIKNRLRDLLIDMIDDSPAAYEAVEPVFGGGFSPIGHSSYLPLLRLVTPAGQDPMQAPVPKAQAPKG